MITPNVKQPSHSTHVTISFLVGLALIGILFLSGCGRSERSPTSDGKVYSVSINQFAPHPILDAVYVGLMKRLSEEPAIQVVTKNANGDRVICQQINEQFFQGKTDLIVALGTPAAQSAVSVTKGVIPVVFGAITDPVGAKLADSLEHPGGNKTGTTNRWPFRKQVTLLRTLFPTLKRVGVIVNPSEANCESGMVVIREAAKALGLELAEIPVTVSAEVVPAVEALRGKADVILISPSNDVYVALDALLAAALRLGLPVVGGDESAVSRGSLATYGFSNEDVGRATGECVVQILKGKRQAGDIPISAPPTPKLYLNRDRLAACKVAIPSELGK